MLSASDSSETQNGITTAVPGRPVTGRRLPAVDINLKDAGVARASFAPSSERPEGSEAYSEELSGLTVLQQHCVFFDKDNDGIIWPLDTFYGFHQIGFNIFLCLLSMVIIHAGFSYVTSPSWIPDPFFRIHIANIHKAKHGSDTGAYDSEGRFVPQNFEDIFSKYGTSPIPECGWQPCMRAGNFAALHKGIRDAFDPFGWGADVFELFAAWWVSDGALKKEEMRALYDGSLFYQRWEVAKARDNLFWRGVGWLVRKDEVFQARVARAAMVNLKGKAGR
jgi:hypothetical protein